jgi:putative transposase
VSKNTLYSWRRQYEGMGIEELRRLKQLEKENAQLKRLVADLSPDKHMLKEVME